MITKTLEELLSKGSKVYGEIVYPKDYVLSIMKEVRRLTIEEIANTAEVTVVDFEYDLQDILQKDRSCDTYIDYTAYTKEWLEENGYDEDLISIRLIELGAENEEEVLIHLDW